MPRERLGGVTPTARSPQALPHRRCIVIADAVDPSRLAAQVDAERAEQLGTSLLHCLPLRNSRRRSGQTHKSLTIV